MSDARGFLPVTGPSGLRFRQGFTPDGSRYVVFDRADGRSTLYGVESLVVAQDTSANLTAQLETPEARGLLAERPSFRPREDTPKTITQLNIGNTHHCNLACTYCYNELPTQKPKEKDAWMSEATAREMVDALFAGAPDAPSVSLVWIGGEALLQKKLVFDTCAYAREKGAALGKAVNLVVYSNGVTLTPDVVTWADEVEASLVVSVDGPPKVHDRDRLFAGGQKSGRIVLDHVKHFIETTRAPVRRVRAVSVGRKRQTPLHQYLFDLGFNEIQVQVAYDEKTTDGFNGVLDLDALLSWYETLLLSGVVIAIEPFAGIIEKLLAGGESPSNYYPCGAGNTLAGITPSGEVVACHHFVRDPGPPMGHVKLGLPLPVLRDALSLPVLEREPCKGCWARHVCGGDCYHRAFTAGHGYTGVMTDECDGKRQIYARTIELFARVNARRPEVLHDVVTRNLTQLAPNPRAYEIEDLTSYE
ncbi:MAG: SPASM domain-containing protein [Myxococcaceae bacterium]|jgi:uncharacterized protein|nr:SPASM domain-containing protein [Myxococcaceae bacterium]MCA3014622.1 SPASM domain-containing protein [Myxococcaceae bacterium]